MKTLVPLTQSFFKYVIIIGLLLQTITGHSQTITFSGTPTHESGSPAAGNDGSIYRYSNVTTNTDALVKIMGRSSNQVALVNIDLTSSGFDKAFQPAITYNNGDVNSATSWYMDFEITFVNNSTTTPVNLAAFYATALDIDGDGNRLRERVSFMSPNSYTLETPTNLSVGTLSEMISGLLTPVKTFTGTTTDHSGIDTSATDLMTTVKYSNTSKLIYRIGATTTGASNKTERNYSIYFKNFAYNTPVVTLPVKLESFTASLNGNKVDLKWTTAEEMNVSHFVVEKSLDGKEYNDAGIVFAYGNTTSKMNYSLADNIGTTKGIIYYRLRSVDVDGKAEVSAARIIRVSKQSEILTISAYPNPVSNELRVTVPATWQGKEVVFEIFDQSGHTMKRMKSGSSGQTEIIAVNDLAKGFYFIKASCCSEVAQQKLVKN